MRGKKGVPHTDPDDPPRRRANKRRGHGTWENDRPPVAGVVGRTSGQVSLEVISRSNRVSRERVVEDHTTPGNTINTDEWSGYAHLNELDRTHVTVCHAPSRREWARDDDGDGVREVHNNTMEGWWVGLRNFLRPFRGVSKHYLDQYVAVFQWIANCPFVCWDFLQALVFTNFAP
jgi:transposase